ncbi:MAG: type II secretion system protein GspC, partial [Steroidobacteraceae bacterium]
MGWLEELKSPGAAQALIAGQGPRLAVIVLAALLAIQAGVVVTSQNHGARAHESSAGSAGAASQRPTLQIPSIVSAHLFGNAAPAVADGDAPQTAAQLVLAGVLAVPDPKRGMAILGPSAAAARLYTVGGAVPGGVSLYSVYPDHVLLDRGGVIESLPLPKKLATAAEAPPPVAASGQLSPGQRLQALAQGNGAMLSGLLRAMPVMVGTKLSGFRIYPGSRASVASFNRLGLRANDVITAVNGTPLDDVNRGNEILQTLSSAATATVTVQRNGQSQELNLNLATVANDAENAAAQAAQVAQGGQAAAAAARRSGVLGPMPGG